MNTLDKRCFICERTNPFHVENCLYCGAEGTKLSIVIPPLLSRRPIYRGMPIPYVFHVAKDGTPDFKVLDEKRYRKVLKERRCALCSERLGHDIYFIGGPLCYGHKHFGDPAMHEQCARYAMAVCPHLVMGKAYSTAPLKENETRVKEAITTKVPEKFCLLHCTGYEVVKNGPGIAIRAIGEIDVEWFTPKSHARTT